MAIINDPDDLLGHSNIYYDGKAIMTSNFPAPSIIIHGKDNMPILEIQYDGTVVWHAEDQASEAARIFCENLSVGVEQKSGIRESRKKWEHKRYLEIKEALESDELTVERLAEIFKKAEFIGKLSGDETE